MGALPPAQIDGEFLLQRRIDRLVQIMLEQDIFGRNRRIGFELEDPVPIAALAAEQGLRRRRDGAVERRCVEPGSNGFEDRIALHVGT
jgi:hypothetical protein